VVGRNILPLFQWHDHEQFEIESYVGTTKPDSLTDEFRNRSDKWCGTIGIMDAALAAEIQRNGVDILVDLTQHMMGNRLPVFAGKPAPLQVSFAGYPESTGLEAIPYRISDKWMEQDGALNSDGLLVKTNDHEKVYLIDSFWCYDPCGIEVKVNDLPARAARVITFGSLNNFCKVNDPLLKLWTRVLRAVRNSHLIVLSHEGSHRQRARQFLEAEGVEPQRLEFVAPRPRKEYMELYHRLDIVLDTFPYNGHTTSLDALWMGVPVVSLCGERPVSRAGLSQLSNLGLPELVAFTDDQYVKIASQLASDISHLQELRAALRPRMEKSVLMDAPHFARQIEACYRSMWRQWCESQKA
jgi:predicted O-linked N-acetylglucosamine transferase (SPINDLY family)